MEIEKTTESGGDASSLNEYDEHTVESRNDEDEEGSPQPPLEPLVQVSWAMTLGMVAVVADRGKDEG